MMYIIKGMQRLSLSSNVIRTLIIFSIFFSTVVVVIAVIGIPIQANAKKKMMMITTSISPPPSLDGNSVLNDQNTPSTNISNAQQGVDNNSTNNVNGDSNINNSSYLIYENPTERISMMYASNWQKIEYPPGAMGYGVGHRIIANFLAPINSSDRWRGSLNIQISSQSDLKNLIPQGANAAIANLGSHRAFKLEYTNNEKMYLNRNLTNFNTINLKIMQVWTTVGDNTYLLTYTAEASRYMQYLPIIQKMLDSFKVS
jgi:hypothetical protein